jgi:hypothetical protein
MGRRVSVLGLRRYERAVKALDHLLQSIDYDPSLSGASREVFRRQIAALRLSLESAIAVGRTDTLSS